MNTEAHTILMLPGTFSITSNKKLYMLILILKFGLKSMSFNIPINMHFIVINVEDSGEEIYFHTRTYV